MPEKPSMSVPGIPEAMKLRPSVFVLLHKRDANTALQLNFEAESKEAAIELGQAYCSHFNYRFLNVIPFLADLRGEMEKHQ